MVTLKLTSRFPIIAQKHVPFTSSLNPLLPVFSVVTENPILILSHVHVLIRHRAWTVSHASTYSSSSPAQDAASTINNCCRRGKRACIHAPLARCMNRYISNGLSLVSTRRTLWRSNLEDVALSRSRGLIRACYVSRKMTKSYPNDHICPLMSTFRKAASFAAWKTAPTFPVCKTRPSDFFSRY